MTDPTPLEELAKAELVHVIMNACESGDAVWIGAAREISAAVLAWMGEQPQTTVWEYAPGHIGSDGHVFVHSGIIAPDYVQQYMRERGYVIRRRVGPWEEVIPDA